jgi:hypothetical protein
VVVAQRVTVGVDSFVLLAIPFFFLAGILFNNLGITEKIFNFIRRFDSGDTFAALKKAVGLIRNRTRHIRGMNIILVKERTIYLSTFLPAIKTISRCDIRRSLNWSSVQNPFLLKSTS